MKGEEYLRQLLNMRNVLEEKYERICRLRVNAERITATITGMPHASGNSSSMIENYVVKIEEAEEDYLDFFNQVDMLETAVVETLSKLSRKEYKSVIWHHFFEGDSFSDISKDIGYCPKSVSRFYADGMAELDLLVANA